LPWRKIDDRFSAPGDDTGYWRVLGAITKIEECVQCRAIVTGLAACLIDWESVYLPANGQFGMALNREECLQRAYLQDESVVRLGIPWMADLGVMSMRSEVIYTFGEWTLKSGVCTGAPPRLRRLERTPPPDLRQKAPSGFTGHIRKGTI